MRHGKQKGSVVMPVIDNKDEVVKPRPYTKREKTFVIKVTALTRMSKPAFEDIIAKQLLEAEVELNKNMNIRYHINEK